jgi:hypothetical protein
MKDRVIDALIHDVHTAEQVLSTINGLLLAQIICRRVMLEAFDEDCQVPVLAVMEEIVKTIDHLREEYLHNENKSAMSTK